MAPQVGKWLERIYGIEVQHLGPHEITFPCPHCGKGNKHFQFNLQKRLGHCFRCGWRTTLLGLISEVAGVSKKRAKEILRHHGIQISPTDTYVKPTPKPFERCKMPPRSDWTTRALEYLHDRDVTDYIIEKYGLYYCGTGRYQGRVIIPVVMDHMIVSFQARTIYPNEKKRYDNPPGAVTSRCLFGYNLISKHVTTDRLVIVEGPFDVMAVNEVDSSTAAVGCFGKSISEEQLDLLAKVQPKKYILMFDSDADIAGMWKVLTLRFTNVRIVMLGSGDPAECKNLERRLDEASKNLQHAKWRMANEALNLQQLVQERKC